MVAGCMLNSKKGVIETLRDKAEEKTKNLKQSVDKLSETVTGAASRGLNAVRYEKENLGAALDAGKQAYRAAKEMTP